MASTETRSTAVVSICVLMASLSCLAVQPACRGQNASGTVTGLGSLTAICDYCSGMTMVTSVN